MSSGDFFQSRFNDTQVARFVRAVERIADALEALEIHRGIAKMSQDLNAMGPENLDRKVDDLREGLERVEGLMVNLITLINVAPPEQEDRS